MGCDFHSDLHAFLGGRVCLQSARLSRARPKERPLCGRSFGPARPNLFRTGPRKRPLFFHSCRLEVLFLSGSFEIARSTQSFARFLGVLPPLLCLGQGRFLDECVGVAAPGSLQLDLEFRVVLLVLSSLVAPCFRMAGLATSSHASAHTFVPVGGCTNLFISVGGRCRAAAFWHQKWGLKT